MGKSSQAKGRRGELELVQVLHQYGFESVQPGEAVSYGEVPDVTGLPGVHCEVKRAEQIRLSAWLQQAELDAARFGDGVPVVFHRRNREPWRVTMNLSAWMEIYRFFAEKRTEKGDTG